MEISLFFAFIGLLWVHFFGDFVCQTDEMATKKSSSCLILLSHCCVYSIPLLVFATMFGPYSSSNSTPDIVGWALTFAYINLVLHFITDAISSRITSTLWKKQQRHWFFVAIGADQAVHLTCLFGTWVALHG